MDKALAITGLMRPPRIRTAETLKRNRKAIALATLVAMVAVPVSGTPVAEAKADAVDTDYPKSAYYEKLLRQDAVRDMTERQKSEFVQKVADYFSSTPYHENVFALIDNLAEIEMKMMKAEANGLDADELARDAWAVIYDLENYGVVSEDRLVSNPEYWMALTQDAMERANGKGTSQAISGSGGDGIVWAHMSGVELLNQSDVGVPCTTWFVITFYCPNLANAHGVDTKTKTSSIAAAPGTFYMYSRVCLEDADHHDAITTTFDRHHKVSNAFGTVKHLADTTHTYSIDNEDCKTVASEYDGIQAVAGSTAHSHTYVWQTVSFV